MRARARRAVGILILAGSVAIGCGQQPELSVPDTLVSPTQLGAQVATFQGLVRRRDWNRAYGFVSARCQAVWRTPEALKVAVGDHDSTVSPLDMQTTKTNTDATVSFVWDGAAVRQHWQTDPSGSWKYDSCD